MLNVWWMGWGIMLKRRTGVGGCDYPHSLPIVKYVPRGTFSIILYIIRYETPPPPINYTYIYKV